MVKFICIRHSQQPSLLKVLYMLKIQIEQKCNSTCAKKPVQRDVFLEEDEETVRSEN